MKKIDTLITEINEYLEFTKPYVKINEKDYDTNIDFENELFERYLEGAKMFGSDYQIEKYLYKLQKENILSEENEQYLALLNRINKFAIKSGSYGGQLVAIAMKTLVIASLFDKNETTKEKYLTAAMALRKFL